MQMQMQMHVHYATCVFLILFFAGLLLHAAMHHSKSAPLIEGLEPSLPSAAAPPNPSEIAFIKDQIATLAKTAQTLKTQMIKNEKGIQDNTTNIEKVAQSQTETVAQMAAMKSAK
jgi:hypothetical protein